MASQSLPAMARWTNEGREKAVEGLQAQLRCLQIAIQAGLAPFALLVWAGLSLAGVLGRWGLEPPGLLFAFLAAAAWPVGLVWAARLNTRWSRRRAEAWFGARIPQNYVTAPPLTQDERGHWWTGHSYYRDRRTADLALSVRTVATDQQTWRDLKWLVVNGVLAAVLAVPCLGLFVFGVGTAIVQLRDSYQGVSDVYSFRLFILVPVLQPLAMVFVGLVLAAVGLLMAPSAVRQYGQWMRRTLDPQTPGAWDKARLTKRVEHLTSSRADAVGSQAAELRRIERDLHDGAQARLVAIGMTLGTIEHLMETDPPAARELLAEARQSSAKALQELRDLVRGIHPPVLAERGLGDAVRALALDSAQNTEVTVSLPTRPEAPVEAAAYFCVSELLANAAKHSGAQQVWVDILFRAGQLRITVTDDGHGGANPERGSGLRGIERRLGTFDGVLSLSSPAGGPTTITMELPCALSSQRTSTFSERA
ncbi:sensor histidine kinase [Kitasatospora sp. GP82]|uniref:sensor histidine kinase n=1 Tax=Kitasatospora sp. GP82 TaxID=3035089 RepID=UPI0024748A5F|nr:sensor histidine kinase [Kitasatospora sp. GP82]MDH6128620.1 signal transduction histidine kinase [Kitasatospora sp. GP82]